MKKIALLLIPVFIVGCASTPNDFNQEYHERAKNIPLISDSETVVESHSVLGVVKSNSCNEKSLNRVVGDVTEAQLLLKLEAAMLGADAVVGYKCWTSPLDLVNNCWASKKCEGTAIKYAPPKS